MPPVLGYFRGSHTACDGSNRDRYIGFNCGIAHNVPGNFPICTGWRGGDWSVPTHSVFGPYAPTKIILGGTTESAAGAGNKLTCVASGVYRGPVYSTGVPLDGWTSTHFQSTSYTRYNELVFSSTSPGGVVLTAYTIAHPDSRFPAEVTWHNKNELSESTTLTLTSSTQFQDAIELLPFLNVSVMPNVIIPEPGLDVPAGDEPSLLKFAAHGTPAFHPDGSLGTRRADHFHHVMNLDASYRTARYGDIFCHQKLSHASAPPVLCGTMEIPDFPVYCRSGGVYHTIEIGLKSDLCSFNTGDSRAYHGSADFPYAAADSQWGVGGLRKVSSTSPECTSIYGAYPDYWTTFPPSYGPDQVGPRASFTWTANCTDVEITASVPLLGVSWNFTGLPFDWWTGGTYTAVANHHFFGDDAGVMRDTTFIIKILPCDYAS